MSPKIENSVEGKETKVSKLPQRKVKYPKPQMELAIGKKAIRASRAKDLLGWVEETSKVSFGSDYLLKDLEGVKIRCLNDIRNRPLYEGIYQSLKQEILRGHWECNFENIIIGKTGIVLNGQHRLIALILAVQEWGRNREAYPNWKTAPVIETSLAFGASEEDKVVNTMDTCKPRSLADVIYRSPFFSHLSKAANITASRMLDNAVRLLWDRTGAKSNAYAPRRTHSEALDFIQRHRKLLECVSHIREEKQGVGKIIGPGYGSGLLYLMGSSTTNPQEYFNTDPPNEGLLDWENWDKACDFFVFVAQDSPDMKPLIDEMLKRMNSDEGMSRRERFALIAKAWIAYARKGKVTAKDLKLSYTTNSDQLRVLDEVPSVGGIDLAEGEMDEEHIAGSDPSESTIKLGSKKSKTGTLVKGNQQHSKGWTKGDTAWLFNPVDSADPCYVTLTDKPYVTVQGPKVMVTTEVDDGEWEVSVDHLHIDYPEAQESA